MTNPEGSAKFADKNYIVINSEPGVVLRGRKGTTGIIVSKSTQALVVGLYDNNDVQPGDASKVVEGIGEYLKSVVRDRVVTMQYEHETGIVMFIEGFLRL